MSALNIVYLPPASLLADPHNARVHSASQVKKLARSIERFGFNSVILIDEGRRVLCGHGRLEAALKLKLKEVPTVQVSHLTPAQKRAFMLADNKLAELGEWSPQILGEELRDLVADNSIEITDTAFDMAEVDLAIELVANDDDPDDVVPTVRSVPAVTRRGDLWKIGDHLVFCGDALDPHSYHVLLGSERAQMILCDPPYNQKISDVSNFGRTKHPEFEQASGEMSSLEFQRFLATACQCMFDASIDGSIHFLFMDWRGLADLFVAGAKVYAELKNLAVWVKPRRGMGALYRSQHELVAVYKAGTAPHINNIMLGKAGRDRSNVLFSPGGSGSQRGREDESKRHPSPKNISILADLMLDCSNRNGLILDSFGGSGSTLVAADRCGRRARLIEISPHYVDVILARARKRLGAEPINLWTGAGYDELVANLKQVEEQRA